MVDLDTARAMPAATGHGPQIDRLGGAIDVNNHHFLEKASFRDRAWWQHEAERLGSDWAGFIELELAILEMLIENDFMRAYRNADEQRPKTALPNPSPRPTPHATIEAIMHTVRERGTAALGEPANIERLRQCDAAAKKQINERIAKLSTGLSHVT